MSLITSGPLIRSHPYKFTIDCIYMVPMLMCEGKFGGIDYPIILLDNAERTDGQLVIEQNTSI